MIDRETVNRWSHEVHQELRDSGADYDCTDVILLVAQRAAEGEREALEKIAEEQRTFFGERIAAAIRARGMTKEI